MNGQPAVLIMARAPRAGEVRRALEPLLGREGCRELQAKLIARAAAWARKVGAGALHVAHDPPDAGSELRRLVGGDAVVFPQNGEGITGRLADASARVLSRSGGPLLIVWPDLPRFRVAPDQAAQFASGIGWVVRHVGRPRSHLARPDSRAGDQLGLELAASLAAEQRLERAPNLPNPGRPGHDQHSRLPVHRRHPIAAP